MPPNESAIQSVSISGERKLAAIMFTDMVGFSRQMGADETRMLRLLDIHNQLIQQAVSAHHGHVIKTIGDAFLVDFPSVVHAVQGAQQIQSQFRDQNTEKEKAEQIHVRIGIHLGDIVQKIVTTLKLQLTLMEQGFLVRKHTDNLEAYDYYLRGVESLWRGWRETRKEANTQARQFLEHATVLDLTYAEAYTWLGGTYYFDWFFGWNRTPQTLARAGELAQQAIALDDTLSTPYALLGILHLWKKEHDQAIAEAQRAVTLDPNNAEGYFNLGSILAFAERAEEAIELIEKAMRLNPRYPPTYVFQLSVAYRMAGRYEEALVSGKQALAFMPNSGPTHFNLAVIYSELDRAAEAQTEAAEMRRRFPNASVENFRQFLPFKNPADIERHLNALRKAGLK